MTSNLLGKISSSKSAPKELNEQLNKLFTLTNQYDQYKMLVEEGIRFAFSEGMTPKLDSAILTGFIEPRLNP